jgi:hypothetical protein
MREGEPAAATRALTQHLRRSITEAMALAPELWPEADRPNKGRAELLESLSPKTRKIKAASSQSRQAKSTNSQAKGKPR